MLHDASASSKDYNSKAILEKRSIIVDLDHALRFTLVVILSFDEIPVQKIDYNDMNNYRIYKDFMKDRDKYQ